MKTTPLFVALAVAFAAYGSGPSPKAQKLWDEYRTALKSDSNVLPLPQPSTFDAPAEAVWHLPDNLEPKADMSFVIMAQGERPETGRPLYIYLHGSGPRDGEWKAGKVLTQRWTADGEAWFVPRIPNEGQYYRWWQQSKQYAWENLLRRALASDEYDPDRIYMLGISEGGYGSQRLASFYADYLAGAGPMAGGEPLVNAPADNLRNTPFSLMTGSVDRGFYRNLLTARTGKALDSLAAANPGDYKHRVLLQEGRGHAIDYAPTATWLRENKRRLSPAHVTWEDYPMDGLRRKAFANIEPLTRPADDTRYRYDLVIDKGANSIALNVDTVFYRSTEVDPNWGIVLDSERTFSPVGSGKARIYLDDSMLDLGKKINITVNGRKLKAVKAKRSDDTVRRAIELWGDPRRLYEYAVELDW